MLIKLHNPSRKRGFTLTEIAIVLGIIGLILGAIWTAASRVYANQKVNKGVNEVIAIANAMRATYGGRGYVDAGDLTAAGIQFGWYPQDMVSGANAVTPWNTNLHVGNKDWGAGNPANSNNFSMFFVTVNGTNGIPANICPAFMAALVSQASSVHLVQIYSDATGGPLNIDPGTTVDLTDTHVTNCNGQVVLSFTL